MAAPNSRPSSPNSSFHNCPVSATSTSQKLFAEITSPMSPLPLTPAADPMHFEKLRRVQVRNTHVTAEQVSSFITRHAANIKSIDFDNVVLTTGTWDDALAPLRSLSSKEAIWEARHSGSFTGTDVGLLSGGSSVTTPIEEEGNPYRWQPKEVAEDSCLPLRESYVEAHMASTPSHVNIAKKHRRRRRRRTASPPPPPPSLRHQASHLLGKLKREASQSSFFSMFKHHESGSSSSFPSIKEAEPEDNHIFLATPGHNRAMPSVPTNQDDYFDLGKHDFSPPAYEHGLETLLQAKTYTAPITPPRTPRMGESEGTPRSQIWEFDRPSSLTSIKETPLPQTTTYSPVKVDSRHPLNRQPTVEDRPLTPPESPVYLLSPSVYTPSSTKTSPAKNTSPCQQHQQRQEGRVRGQPVPRPPTVKPPAWTPMLGSIKTPVTPWPTSLHRSCTPLPLTIDTNVPHAHRQRAVNVGSPSRVRQPDHLNTAIQGNQRDLIREAQYKELANDSEKRDEVLKRARERVMGRLGRKYSGRNPSTTSLAPQGAVMGRTKEINVSDMATRVGRGNGGMGHGQVKESKGDVVRGRMVQDAVRKEMWGGCGDDFADEVRESSMDPRGLGNGGKERSVLVPFMILR